MFKNKKEVAGTGLTAPSPQVSAPAPRPKPRPSSVPSIISGDTVIHGNLESSGDVQIEGAVIGDIAAKKLVIADGGSVSGNVAADDVRICGALTGAVRSEMVTLTSTARVLGDIFHELLAIETGGRLEGQSRRLHPDPQAIAAPVETPPEPQSEVMTNGGEGGEHAHHNGHDHGHGDGHDHGHHHDHGHDQHDHQY